MTDDLRPPSSLPKSPSGTSAMRLRHWAKAATEHGWPPALVRDLVGAAGDLERLQTIASMLPPGVWTLAEIDYTNRPPNPEGTTT